MPKAYSDRTKKNAVEEILAGRTTIAALARGLKINQNTLYRWRAEYLAKNGKYKTPDALLTDTKTKVSRDEVNPVPKLDEIEANLAQLRADIHILEQAKRILKNGKA